tara:strand:- start:1074 stop:1370 length:297 start_codon:yes stop_codon:yes gene_type:complete
MDLSTMTNEQLAKLVHMIEGFSDRGSFLDGVLAEMGRRGIAEIEEIQIDLMGDLSWRVHYADYTIATFRNGFEVEARKFAATLDATDVHQQLKHHWGE